MLIKDCHIKFVKLCMFSCVHLITMFLSIRSQSKSTNLGRMMESHGLRLLGALYKDPITSFRQFQQFTVQHPEARFCS